MDSEDAKSAGHDYGYSAGLYCEVGQEDRQQACCECEDGAVCEACLTAAAYSSEMNARQFSPWEFTASAINQAEDSEALWEAYDAGVTEGIAEGIAGRFDADTE